MSYQFINQVTPEQLQQLTNPIQASSVIEEIAALAEQTIPAKTEQVAQWMKLFEQYGIVAQRNNTGTTGISVLPGGTASRDRIAMTVADGIATITGVSEAAA